MRTAIGYRWTLAAGALASISALAERRGWFDLSDSFASLHASLEPYHLEELLIGAALLLPALVVDMYLIRRRERDELARERERLRTLRATMHTVQDLVNNALTGMQQLRMEAQSKRAVSPEILDTFDRIVEDTALRLRALGDVDEVRERRSSSGVTFIDYPQPEDERDSPP